VLEHVKYCRSEFVVSKFVSFLSFMANFLKYCSFCSLQMLFCFQHKLTWQRIFNFIDLSHSIQNSLRIIKLLIFIIKLRSICQEVAQNRKCGLKHSRDDPIPNPVFCNESEVKNGKDLSAQSVQDSLKYSYEYKVFFGEEITTDNIRDKHLEPHQTIDKHKYISRVYTRDSNESDYVDGRHYSSQNHEVLSA